MMLSQKMAGGSMLRLIQGMSNLNIYSMPWNISQRCIGSKALNEKLGALPKPPKRPGNAYIEFKAEVDPEIKRKNPELSIIERSRIVGQLWRESSQEKKDKYKEIAQRKFQKYKQELENLEKSLSPQQKAEIEELKNNLKRMKDDQDLKAERQKKTVSLEKPKRPLNPYMRFIQAQGFPPGSRLEFLKETSAKWSSMSENQKRPFVQEFEKECAEYYKKMEAWEKKMISQGHFDVVRTKTLKEKFNKS